jgi:hypothetical protein
MSQSVATYAAPTYQLASFRTTKQAPLIVALPRGIVAQKPFVGAQGRQAKSDAAGSGDVSPNGRSMESVFQEKNRRRLDLIDKEFDAGLSDIEETELERLQRETAALLSILRPTPTRILDELEALAARLETEATLENP